MYPVTQDFENEIFNVPRQILGRVTFDISPVNIENDIPTITTTSDFALADKNQLIDNIRTPSLYLITWETGRTILDGRFTFPSDNEVERGQVGWVSAEITIPNSSFDLEPSTTLYPSSSLFPSSTVSQDVTLQFTGSYTSAGITVTFDPLLNEYASDFSIFGYDSGNALIFQQNVIGNTLSQYILQSPITNFNRLVIKIYKWCLPNRRARIVEIDPGVVLTYTDSELIRFSSTEEMDPLSSSIVIPEFQFTVSNLSGTFDILNPTGIYSYLQLRQRINAELGLVIDETRTEWVPVGTYYLSEWKSDPGALTATFTGRSLLDLLDNATFGQLSPQTGYSLYDLIEDILLMASITSYQIDTALQAISTNGLIETVSCRQALQFASIAGRANVFVTRDNKVKVQVYNPSQALVKGITLDEMFEEPQIEAGKPVYSVQVFYYTTIGTEVGSYTKTEAGNAKGEVIVLQNNYFINTISQAQAVAEWLYAVRNNSKVFTVDYRGNQALELNDRLIIENRYNQTQQAVMIKNEMTYEGYLTAKMEGRA